MNIGRHLYQFVLAVLIGIGTLLPAQVHAFPRPGQQAPNFKVVTTSGQPVSLNNYRGYVLVMDFFATWCPPCRASIPHLMTMNRKYGKQGLQILGQSLDEDGESVVREFVAEQRINYPVALATEKVAADYGINSVPVLVVIDKRGKVVEVYHGFSDEIGRSMENLIRKLLAEK
ncbi:MAG TPA: TlpA disulfide reductase family protein [Desulfuromonadaceae bacterium]